MENQGVQYVLSLKDFLSSGLDNADKRATKLSSTMSELGVIVGAAFGAFAAYEFLKGSVSAFNENEQAAAQLEASLKSTGNTAGLTLSALEEQGKILSENTLFTNDQITSSQALLTTFTQVHSHVFNQAIPAITDLAAKMGGDLQGATLQVGKALNDPVAGLTALRRVGVAFSDTQKTMIENFVKTGDVASAQNIIIKELNTEFGGSAKAAAETGTGPFTVLVNRFHEFKASIGGVVVSILNLLLPAFTNMVAFLENSFKWLQQNKEIVEAVAIGVGVFAAGLFALQIPLIASTIAGYALSGAFAAISFVLSISPLGWLIGVLAVVTGAFVLLWKKSEIFRGALFGLWEVVKNFASAVKSYFTGIFDIMAGVLTGDIDRVKKGLGEVKDAYKDVLNTGEAYAKGQKAGVASFKADQAEDAVKKSDPGKKNAFAAIKEGAYNETKQDPTTSTGKVVGNKSISIDVKIGNLIGEYNVTTNNIREAANNGRAIVVEALIGAVNDFELAAGR